MKYSFIAAIAAAALTTTAFGQNNLVDVGRLNGAPVTNMEGKKLGEIEQVLVDSQTGRLRYAVVEVDKFWRIDDPKIAVPWQALKLTREGKDVKLALDATKEKLENSPRFKLGDADRLYTKSGGAPVYSYWAIAWFEDATPEANASPSPKAGSEKSPAAGSSPDEK